MPLPWAQKKHFLKFWNNAKISCILSLLSWYWYWDILKLQCYRVIWYDKQSIPAQQFSEKLNRPAYCIFLVTHFTVVWHKSTKGKVKHEMVEDCLEMERRLDTSISGKVAQTILLDFLWENNVRWDDLSCSGSATSTTKVLKLTNYNQQQLTQISLCFLQN